MNMTSLSIIKLNELLSDSSCFESSSNGISEIPQLPVIFIIGLPRSGTTPLSQLLIQRFKLGYVSNLIARFWEAPEVGIALAKEISEDPGRFQSDLHSTFGFTKGYEGHHEFGYFWRRWFDFEETHYLDAESQSLVDTMKLKRQLSIMEKTWGRPLIFKNAAALPLQTEFMAKCIPNSLFIHIQRDPLSVAASLLRGRREYMGNIDRWFSIKPKEYIFLKNKTVPEQIAGQVYYTKEHMKKQIVLLPNHRKLEISYTDLCLDTTKELDRINTFIRKRYNSLEEREGVLPKLSIQSSRIKNTDLIPEINKCFEGLERQSL